MQYLPLHGGQFAIVDDDIFDQVKDRRWHISHYGYPATNSTGGRKDSRAVLLHHLILGKPPVGMVTDHRNQNKLDARRENLRFVSRRLNNLNSRNRRWYMLHQGKWRVRFKVGVMLIDISGIESKEEAQSIAALLKGSLMYHELTKGGC